LRGRPGERYTDRALGPWTTTTYRWSRWGPPGRMRFVQRHTPPRNEIRRANGRNRQADNHFGKIISFRRIQCVSEFGGLSPETGPNRAFGMGIFGQLRPPSGVRETYPGNEKRIRGGRFVAGRPRTNSPSAGRCHRPGRANTQATRATQVTANRTGTAKASGREMASPSVRPGTANPARVRPDSGTNRFDGNLAVARPGLDRTRDWRRVPRVRASSPPNRPAGHLGGRSFRARPLQQSSSGKWTA